MICKGCNSSNLISRGYLRNKSGKKKRYQCTDCGKYTSEINNKTVAARVLLFDIETAPLEVYVWGLRHNNYISPDNIVKDYSVLCWSAKWLFESDVFGEAVSLNDAVDREDKSILKKIWKLLDEADIVIVQNGKKFDIPKLNTRFIRAGFSPPMYYQVIDTKDVMEKNFSFSSNKLDYVNQFLGLGGKSDMDFQDWVNCVSSKVGIETRKKSLLKMFEYNKRDVQIMEELYLIIRPWIPSHSNLGIYADVDKDCCPNCQSTELKWSGQYATPLGLYVAFRCLSCGAIGRSTKKLYKIKQVNVRG